MEIKIKPYNHAEAYLGAQSGLLTPKRRKKMRNYGKESDQEQKRKKKEERLNKLAEYSSPEKQKIKPGPQDRLSFLSPWHFTLVLTGLTIVILGLFALITIAQGRNQLGLEVSRLVKEQDRLKEVNGRLKAGIEELLILEDLEIIAEENMNLQTPKKGQIYVLE
jgi:hypothetical protein